MAMKNVQTAGITEKIDDGLAGYYVRNSRMDYANHKGIGKFKVFVEDNGFDDNDVRDELEGDADDCLLTDFDIDNDGNINFPFETQIDDNVKNEEIVRILTHIAINGFYGSDNKNILIDIKNILNVKQQDINETVRKHIASITDPFERDTATNDKIKNSMKTLIDTFKKNEDLLYFLAVSDTMNFPFLTYLIDKYTQDKTRFYYISHKTASIWEWTSKQKSLQALKDKNKDIFDKLISAMHSYGTRIAPLLCFPSTLKIKDNLEKISKYISVIPKFIKNLLDKQMAVPPFQLDFTIAVRGVTLAMEDDVKNEQSDRDDDDDDDDDVDDDCYDDEKQLDPSVDHIGNVAKLFKELPVLHISRNTEQPIESVLTRKWFDVRDAFSKYASDGRKDVVIDRREYFNAKTFPQNKRFGIFSDRREKYFNDNHDLTVFLYPNDSNTIPIDHVPEINFDLTRRCIIPNITSLTNVCGQLITLSFIVEQLDGIRCYLYWNGQTMRFQGEDIIQVLPFLFENSEENVEFIKKSTELEEMKKAFNSVVRDSKYETFCKELNQ
eukprot:120183_1